MHWDGATTYTKLSKFVAAASEREDSHSENVFSAVVRFPTNSAKTVHTRTDHMSSVTQVIYEVDIESKNEAHKNTHTHTHQTQTYSIKMSVRPSHHRCIDSFMTGASISSWKYC